MSRCIASLLAPVAHEYAHHVQHADYNLSDRAKKNITKVELQADCYAGIMLSTNRKYPFTVEDANEMLANVYEYGDNAYDHEDHHEEEPDLNHIEQVDGNTGKQGKITDEEWKKVIKTLI